MSIALFIFSLIQLDSVTTVIVESSQQLFQKAVSISAASDGMIFVIDQFSNTLQEISNDNRSKKSIGGQGWGNDAFDLPTDVSSRFLLDIFVVDANNRRVQRYDKQFNFVQTYDEKIISSISGRFQPMATATSAQGDLYILEKDGKRVIALTPRGQFIREFGTFKESTGKLTDPKDIAVSGLDEVFVLDRNAVMIYDNFGNYLRRIVLSPTEEWKSITISGNTLIATSALRIEIFYFDTEKRLIISPQSFFGAKVHQPFSDALIQDSALIILTQTTLYRCSIP